MMFVEGNIATCWRCQRPIILLAGADGFPQWQAQFDDYLRDCPHRRGERCTPYPPETF